MSGIDDSGTPLEVPEEYAATYRDAYLRALAEQGGEDDIAPPPVTIAPEPGDELLPLRPVLAGGARSARPLVPFLLGGALLLVLAIVLVVVLTSGDDKPSPAPRTGIGVSGPSHPASRHTRRSAPSTAATGSFSEVAPTRVRATCTAPPGVDSGGAKVQYSAGNTLDHDPSTAWRCDGSALGEQLTFSLPPGSEVTGFALIPGYAKTDPDSHADRYAENNRITQVRWTFSDGSSVEQRLDPDPHQRALQVLRVPATASDEVTLEVLAVQRGPRNTTAISEVEVLRG